MITHHLERMKFYTLIDGHQAELTYQREENVLIFDHTYVPDELRGKGLAAELVKTGLTYAKENNLKVRPVCPYVVGYFDKHPGEVAGVRE